MVHWQRRTPAMPMTTSAVETQQREKPRRQPFHMSTLRPGLFCWTLSPVQSSTFPQPPASKQSTTQRWERHDRRGGVCQAQLGRWFQCNVSLDIYIIISIPWPNSALVSIRLDSILFYSNFLKSHATGRLSSWLQTSNSPGPARESIVHHHRHKHLHIYIHTYISLPGVHRAGDGARSPDQPPPLLR